MTKKQRILDAAMAEAQQHGYKHVTREAIAQRAACATGLVSYHLGTMVELRRALMSEAIRTRNARIIAQGLADGHSKARRAPDDLKAAAIALMMR